MTPAARHQGRERRAERAPELPSPGVAFGADFLPRLGRIALRLRSEHERHEGAGRSRLFGVGSEVVGFRPYRPGEDLRHLDWSLYARMRRPFVRVARREASERWAILVDTSASMGVGRPGKLQLAAELATAIAAVGLGHGASIELFCSGRDEGIRLRRRPELRAWMRFLETCRAGGSRGLAELVREPARVRGAGAVFLLGDLFDLEPRDTHALLRRGRELFCAQLLAPEELSPKEMAVRWVDAETGEGAPIEVDRQARHTYEALLSRRLEAWGAACARHGTIYGFWRSTTPFESIVTELFEG